MQCGLVVVVVQVQRVFSRLREACCELCLVALCILIDIVLIFVLSSDIFLCDAVCSSESSTTDA